MLLLVGLGNPGTKYAGNRHNIGFQLIDLIAAYYGFSTARQKFTGLLHDGHLPPPSGIDGIARKTFLLKPQTFYNEAGKSVAAAAKFHKIPLENIIVIHDDLDLAPGKIKIKRGGGTGGNNGLRSISSHLGPDFRRLRIGIGHPGDKSLVTSYVLGDFDQRERADWGDLTAKAVIHACPYLGLDTALADAKFLSAFAAYISPQHPPPSAQKTPPTPVDKTSKQVEQTAPSLPLSASQTAFADKLKSLFKPTRPNIPSSTDKDSE